MSIPQNFCFWHRRDDALDVAGGRLAVARLTLSPTRTTGAVGTNRTKLGGRCSNLFGRVAIPHSTRQRPRQPVLRSLPPKAILILSRPAGPSVRLSSF